jgi:hypothetical protein
LYPNLPDAIGDDDAVLLERRGPAAQPAATPFADWSDQALDACAPEGAYLPTTDTPRSATMVVWS